MNQANFYELGKGLHIIMPLEHTTTKQIEQIQAFDDQKEEYPIFTVNRTYEDPNVESMELDELCEHANKLHKNHYPKDILKELNRLMDGEGVDSSVPTGKYYSILDYINLGDVYVETICYDPNVKDEEDSFFVGDIGTFYEEWEQEKREEIMTELKTLLEGNIKSSNEYEFENGIGEFKIFDKSHELFAEIVEPSIKLSNQYKLHQTFHKITEYTDQSIVCTEKRPEGFEEFSEYYIILKNSNGYSDYVNSTEKKLWDIVRDLLWDNNENGWEELETF